MILIILKVEGPDIWWLFDIYHYMMTDMRYMYLDPFFVSWSQHSISPHLYKVKRKDWWLKMTSCYFIGACINQCHMVKIINSTLPSVIYGWLCHSHSTDQIFHVFCFLVAINITQIYMLEECTKLHSHCTKSKETMNIWKSCVWLPLRCKVKVADDEQASKYFVGHTYWSWKWKELPVPSLFNLKKLKRFLNTIHAANIRSLNP